MVCWSVMDVTVRVVFGKAADTGTPKVEEKMRRVALACVFARQCLHRLSAMDATVSKETHRFRMSIEVEMPRPSCLGCIQHSNQKTLASEDARQWHTDEKCLRLVARHL